MLKMRVDCQGFFKATDTFTKNNQCLGYEIVQATASVGGFLQVSDLLGRE